MLQIRLYKGFREIEYNTPDKDLHKNGQGIHGKYLREYDGKYAGNFGGIHRKYLREYY